MSRLQAWFKKGKNKYNEARKAVAARKHYDHKLAKISTKEGDFVGYYVGKIKNIKALKDDFKVEMIKT